MEGLRPENLENSIDEEKNPLGRDEKIIPIQFLSLEDVKEVAGLCELRMQFIGKLSDGERYVLDDKERDFKELLIEKAKKGELMYGDNVIGVDELNKFALYRILIGQDFEETMWLDVEGGLIEKFMLETYETNDFAEVV